MKTNVSSKENKMMNNSEYFLGLEETELHSRDWEKDCFYDTYGLYDNEEDEE